MSRRVYAPVESFAVGDRGEFTTTVGDTQVTVSGIVGEIRYKGKLRELRSPENQHLVTYDVATPRKVKCVVLYRYVPEEVDLLDSVSTR